MASDQVKCNVAVDMKGSTVTVNGLDVVASKDVDKSDADKVDMKGSTTLNRHGRVENISGDVVKYNGEVDNAGSLTFLYGKHSIRRPGRSAGGTLLPVTAKIKPPIPPKPRRMSTSHIWISVVGDLTWKLKCVSGC
jgi:hypothetical protein